MKQLVWLVVSASVWSTLLLVACGEREEPTKVEKAPSAKEVKEGAKEAVEEIAAHVQKQREEYERRIEAELEEYGKKLAELQSKAKGVEQQAKADFDQKIEALQKKQQLAHEKLEELKSAGSDTWKNMKSGVEAAMEELDRAYHRVLSSLKLLSLGESARESAEVPAVIALKATLWSEHTKSPVTFSHKKHSAEYKVACSECHHKYEDGKNVWNEGDPVQKCQECHTERTIKGEKQLPPEKQKLNLKLAFHNNCQGCHKKLKMKDREKYADIPTTCVECHPRKKE